MLVDLQIMLTEFHEVTGRLRIELKRLFELGGHSFRYLAATENVRQHGMSESIRRIGFNTFFENLDSFLYLTFSLQYSAYLANITEPGFCLRDSSGVFTATAPFGLNATDYTDYTDKNAMKPAYIDYVSTINIDIQTMSIIIIHGKFLPMCYFKHD